MSQFGAGYMATKLNQPYYNILRHYYTGISLGTKPVTVSAEEVTQKFWAPLGRANIVVTGQIPPKMEVLINGKKREFLIVRTLFQKDAKIDISRYIEDGKNTIVFYPAGYQMNVYVELVESYGGKCEG